MAADNNFDDPLIGQTIAGRYRIISKLGAGGMGAAYRAWDEQVGVPVVIKIPKKVFFEDPQFAERFRREIRLLQGLIHPHIVPITDVGEHDGLPFVVMRFLPGGSLSNRRLRDGNGKVRPNPPGMLHLWLPAIAEALDHVHAQGVVHRDVKPANIFFDAFWGAYLGDFGIAKIVEESDTFDKEQTLTATHMGIGTQEYMSPEQFTPNAAIDGRADQYALAVTAYEMLAGPRPFTGVTNNLIVEVLTHPIPPLASVVRELPASVAAAIERGLAKKPVERFATCRGFAAAVLRDLSPLDDEPDLARLLCPNPKCASILKLPTSAAGRKGKCPKCQMEMKVADDLGALWLLDEARRQRRAARESELHAEAAGVIVAEEGAPETFKPVSSTTPIHKAAGNRRKRGSFAIGVSLVAIIVVATLLLFASTDRSGKDSKPAVATTAASKDQPGPTKPKTERPRGPSQATAEPEPASALDLLQTFSDTKANALATSGSESDSEKSPTDHLEVFLTDLPEENLDPPEGLFGKHGQHPHGVPLVVEDISCPKGILLHSDSHSRRRVTYVVPAGSVRFRSQCGIQNNGGTSATPLIFKVLDDAGQELWASDAVSSGRTGRQCDIDLKATKSITLVVECPGSCENANAVWLDPRFVMAEQIPDGMPHSLENTIGIRFRLIPAGTFQMGSNDGEPDEKPVHEVRITRPFYLGVTEVTNAQWKAVMGSVPSQWKNDDRPVESVTWDDALMFCEKLSALPAEKATGRSYRLPTEAEWEYACRAGTTTRYSYGDDEANLGDFAWVLDRPGGTPTHWVAQKKANQWGLHDMHGNVLEWCSDRYGTYDNGAATDPHGPPQGSDRVIRGGSGNHNAWECRASARSGNSPTNTSFNLGCRVVLNQLDQNRDALIRDTASSIRQLRARYQAANTATITEAKKQIRDQAAKNPEAPDAKEMLRFLGLFQRQIAKELGPATGTAALRPNAISPPVGRWDWEAGKWIQLNEDGTLSASWHDNTGLWTIRTDGKSIILLPQGNRSAAHGEISAQRDAIRLSDGKVLRFDDSLQPVPQAIKPLFTQAVQQVTKNATRRMEEEADILKQADVRFKQTGASLAGFRSLLEDAIRMQDEAGADRTALVGKWKFAPRRIVALLENGSTTGSWHHHTGMWTLGPDGTVSMMISAAIKVDQARLADDKKTLIGLGGNIITKEGP